MNAEPPYRVAPSYGLEKCPHCGGYTAARRDKSVHWACGACGKPVIPGVDATKLGLPGTNALLAAAEALESKHEARGGVVFLGLLLAASAASAESAGFVLTGGVFVAFALVLFARRFVNVRYRRLTAALVHIDDARLHAATVLVRDRGGHMTAKDLAATIRIAIPEAEHLLTRLSVDRGHVAIDADQELHYRVDVAEPLDSEPPSASAKRAKE